MDVEIINRIIFGRIEPHIYAFETGTVPNYLKIGDTYRPVEVRLNEWRRYFEDLVPLYDCEAKVEDVYFRDLSVHDYVENTKKRKRLQPDTFPFLPYYSREFFKEATTDDIKEAIVDIHNSVINNDGKYKLYSMADGRIPTVFHYTRDDKPLKLRPNQEEVVKRFMEAIDKKRTHLLMYAVMRFGKSITAMSCAKEMGARLVVVVSAKADVKSEWQKTVEKHKNFEEYDFVDSESLQRDNSIIRKAQKQEKSLVVCLTLQDLSSYEIKERHKQLFEETIDLLIVDETHFGARAECYGSVLTGATSDKILAQEKKHDDESVEELNSTVHQLKSKIQLHLSGTPYRILMGDEFTDEDIICFCQFTDIIATSQKWDEENLDTKDEWENPYYGFPQMVRFAFNLNQSALKRIDELRKEGVSSDFRILFSPQSIRKDAEGKHFLFKYEKEVLDFLRVIDGSQEDENLLGFLDNARIKSGKLCRHMVCVLPFRASCDAMENLINRHRHELKNLRDYEILNIAGIDNERRFRDNESVNSYIRECETDNRKTFTLTVQRMLTGSTVPEWDTMLYLKDTASPQEYDQAIFRLQNPYVKTYEDADGQVIKYNMKPQTLLVDFDPNRMFYLQELRAQIYDINTDANGNSNLQKRLEQELQVSPIIWMNKSKLQEVTPNNILDAVRNYARERSISDEAKDIPSDRSLLNIEALKEEIMRQAPIGSKNGLKIRGSEKEGEDNIDIPDFELQDDTDNTGEDHNVNVGTKGKDEDLSFEGRLATLYSRILFFAFLTKRKVISLEDILRIIDDGEEHKRIVKNLGINISSLDLLFNHLNPNILRMLDYKIQNINSLANELTLSPIERVETAMKQFGRWSASEVITPNHLACDMLAEIPAERISNDALFLDIASKKGEFAYAILQVFGESYKDKIYSIPTSTIAYEFTRKVYEALDMPVENIQDKYNTYDLIGDNADDIINDLKNMNIAVAVGNPPYQDEGGSGGTNDAPIYQEFCKVSKTVTKTFSTLVIPSKWYTGGREHLLGTFRNYMLSNGTISSMTAYRDGKTLFPDVEIKGGVCYFLEDLFYKGECKYSFLKDGAKETRMRDLNEFHIFIREPQLAQIVSKVLKQAHLDKSEFVEKFISSDTPFGIPTNPSKSKKTRFEVFEDKRAKDDILLYYLSGSKRKIGYMKRNIITKNVCDIDAVKVFIPAAYGAGESFPHQILGVPEFAPKGTVCSQTYLYIKFESENEAINFVSYLKTRFFRILVSAIKITQHAQTSVYHFVPMQDFSHPWTDKELYAKYKLTEEEIAYIESMIKPIA